MECECGEEVKDKNAKYCPECGKELSSTETTDGKRVTAKRVLTIVIIFLILTVALSFLIGPLFGVLIAVFAVFIKEIRN